MRIRNVGKKRFTWRNSSTELHRRLDFWLVNDNLQDDVKTAEIGPSIKSNHSSVPLVIDSVEEQKYGPSFWKLNLSLLEDHEYVQKINNEYYNWLNEFQEISDKRVLWDLIKYRIRQVSIGYSKKKQKERTTAFKKLAEDLKKAEEHCDQDPTNQKYRIEKNYSGDYISVNT